jgi:hypothetical protein
MRAAIRLMLCVTIIVSAALGGCAAAPKPLGRACVAFGHSDSIYYGVPRLYGDMSRGRSLVTARTPDGRGGLVVDVDVWTLYDANAPTLPEHKARFMLDACTLEVRSAVSLS